LRVWPGIVLFFIYTGVEVAAGQWTYSLLTESRSVSAPLAGAAVSAYWGSFTVARMVAAGLVPRIGSRVVLRGALVAAPVGGVLLWLAAGPALHVLALIVLGASLAPVYPLLMAETARRVGDHYALHAVGLQVSAAYLGAGAIPAGVGLAARRYGLDVIGPALAVLAMIILGLHHFTAGQRQPSALLRSAARQRRTS
jgi:fucose permease